MWEEKTMAVTKSVFGKSPEGREISLYTLSNSKGMQAKVTDLGANLVGILVPDAQGVTADVTLGFDSVDRYYKNYSFFGAVIGPCANRTAGAAYTLDGVDYRMDQNDGPNNLHTHIELGFHKRIWDAVPGDNSVTFSLEDEDGHLGYPGHKKVSVTYSLDEENALRLHYHASSDKRTIFNLTNHSYFNLDGQGTGRIEDHELWLGASHFTPVVPGSIPTGEIAPVVGTPMDFTQPKAIGKEIDADFEQLQMTGGYDHNFVLDKPEGAFDWMAKAYCEKTGIALEAYTDCPGVQFYAANFLDNEKGKNGAVYDKRHAFCLESQYCPNAVNDTHFAQPFLKAGEKYDTKTVYRFLVK